MDSPFINLAGKRNGKILEDLFEAAQPNIFRMDGGSEFNNKWVKLLLKNRNIKQIVTHNETKANYAERAIKTNKMKLSKYMYNEQTREWSKALSEITSSYNETYHQSIGMSPAKAMTIVDEDLWVKQYLEEKGTCVKKKPSRSTPYKFKVGEQVKLSF